MGNEHELNGNTIGITKCPFSSGVAGAWACAVKYATTLSDIALGFSPVA